MPCSLKVLHWGEWIHIAIFSQKVWYVVTCKYNTQTLFASIHYVLLRLNILLARLSQAYLISYMFWFRDILVRIRIHGSVPLTNGSGSGSGSGSCSFGQWSSRGQQKNIFQILLLITFRRYIYIILQTWKVIKKSQKSRDKGFSYYFYLIMEGSGSRSRSVPLTNGAGRPKNLRILWIQITG